MFELKSQTEVTNDLKWTPFKLFELMQMNRNTISLIIFQSFDGQFIKRALVAVDVATFRRRSYSNKPTKHIE